MLDGATILLTGGTGSFGQAFVAHALEHTATRAIRVYSRDEAKQADMRRHFNDDPRLRWLIGDVRDRGRLQRAARGCDIVIHAAALKRVEVCEYNPSEAVRTNVAGTENVIEAALDQGVQRAVMIGSDKGAGPVNVYGKSKALAESLWVQANAYAGDLPTRFAVVRYGNVLASRGSVVELFREQALTGTLTITDPRMTRFWLTLPQAVGFVLACLERMHGGEVFVPKLPSMRVMDLARAIAPNAWHKTVGIRPGEKLHETLITEDEARRTRDCGSYYVILPECPFWECRLPDGAVRVPEEWRYQSDTNPVWLTAEKLRELAGMEP